MKMTITEALVELKLLDSRIRKNIGSMEIVGIDRELQVAPITKESARASLQSVTALIDRRAILKSAIVLSNATTMVTVVGKQMTVAEAIERKSSIGYEQSLVNSLSNQLASSQRTIETENERIMKSISTSLEAIYGKDSSKTEEFMTTRGALIAKKTLKLVDPLDASAISLSISTDIENFLMSVDVALNISNATTMIDV
jgi:hypothetical protein